MKRRCYGAALALLLLLVPLCALAQDGVEAAGFAPITILDPAALDKSSEPNYVAHGTAEPDARLELKINQRGGGMLDLLTDAQTGEKYVQCDAEGRWTLTLARDDCRRLLDVETTQGRNWLCLYARYQGTRDFTFLLNIANGAVIDVPVEIVPTEPAPQDAGGAVEADESALVPVTVTPSGASAPVTQGFGPGSYAYGELGVSEELVLSGLVTDANGKPLGSDTTLAVSWTGTDGAPRAWNTRIRSDGRFCVSLTGYRVPENLGQTVTLSYDVFSGPNATASARSMKYVVPLASAMRYHSVLGVFNGMSVLFVGLLFAASALLCALCLLWMRSPRRSLAAPGGDAGPTIRRPSHA